jgi:hypothetical protein
VFAIDRIGLDLSYEGKALTQGDLTNAERMLMAQAST